MRLLLSTALLGLLYTSAPVQAQSSAPLTIEQTMANPDWIGPPVESAWWSWNSQDVLYALKRDNSLVRDMYRQSISASQGTKLVEAAYSDLDTASGVVDKSNQRRLFTRNGDVFLRDLRNGKLTQITRTSESEQNPQFSNTGNPMWKSGQQWYQQTDQGVQQLTDIRAEADPNAAPKPDVLREQQLRAITTLQNDKELRDGLRQQNETIRRADSTRAPMPVYLGTDVQIMDTQVSPDGRYVVVVTQPKNADRGQAGKMPLYVTESGYEEFQPTRTRVGRNNPIGQSLLWVDLNTGAVSPIKLEALPGIDQDPLADLRKAAGKEPLKGLRPVTVGGDFEGLAIEWNDDSSQVAVLLRAVDNKDRWIASIQASNGQLQSRHRLTDTGWINWNFNDFGWLKDNQTLWFLSEESGYSHLYTQRGSERAQQRTSGNWEASSPVLSNDGKSFFLLCNQKWPGDYEVCRLNLSNNGLTEITQLDGVEDFSVSPNGQNVLVRYSQSYLPPQLAVVPANGGNAKVLTDTRRDEFKHRQWIEPKYVQVPSKHGAGTIWGKYYAPTQMEAGKKYPVVMFVHGAGYLQNVSARYPNYFREQMFHNLLVEKGYIVLDLDYRASEGYGRNWRTAIYRNMGHPELEDYLDGIDWLVDNHQADRDKVGIYGGSYGGFMTFMALFREPGKFKAGAALRPVGDWMHYNHGYTSNILNTPDIDPEAYKVSSPLNYAEGLQDHLLIAHGIMDDNVFFQDSVNMTQRLIELQKDNWQIAPYPLERHGFTRADSWLDEYKRILKLFEQNLK